MSLRSFAGPALLVLVLAGCGTPGTPATPSASVAPTTEPSSTVPVEQGLPLPRLPLACTDLFSDTGAANVVGTAVSLRLDELTERNLAESATRQVGVLSCTWGGEFKTDNSWDQHLVIDVLPDADAAFDTGVWQVDDGAIVYPTGSTTSEYRCPWLDADYYSCFANVLVDGYWARADVQGGGEGAPVDTVEARMRALIDDLTAAIAGAGDPNPVWVAPPDVLTGAICAGAADAVAPSYPDSVAIGRAGVLRCEVDGARVSVLPAGDWAVPEIQARGDRPYHSIPALEQVDIAGADLALTGCGDGCYAILAIAGSAVEVYSDTMDSGPFLNELAAIVAQVVAAD